MLLSRGNGCFNIQAFCSTQACQLSTYCTQRKLLPILCTFASLCVKSSATPTGQFKVPHQNHIVVESTVFYKRENGFTTSAQNGCHAKLTTHQSVRTLCVTCLDFQKLSFIEQLSQQICVVLLSNIAVGSFLQRVLYALNAHDELAGTSNLLCLGFLQEKHGWYVTEIRTKGQGKQNKEI